MMPSANDGRDLSGDQRQRRKAPPVRRLLGTLPVQVVGPTSSAPGAWFRAVVVGASIAVAMYLIHHQLQIVYFRTCKANLLTVVFFHRSDVCYALNMAISAIERGYQQGLLALMQWGASAAAIMLPYFCSASASSTRATHAGNVHPRIARSPDPLIKGRVYRHWWSPWTRSSSEQQASPQVSR